ncbi:MAG TPA: response regulator transcription factor [Solirubrobacterales bacterium]|jgi:DNA-binding NarL/FixJ family response regulator|nr:response regulator transcription factor [Solirubrobacterales bacterium]
MPETGTRLRLLIVDDHEVVRAGLTTALGGKASAYEVVGTAADGRSALECLRRTLPDIVALDLRLPDIDGIELCRKIRQGFPSVSIVVLSTYLSESTVRDALQAGATGYVTKAAGLSELFATLDRCARPASPKPDESAPQIVDHLHRLVARRMETAPPTPRQERVLELAARGLTNKAIGAELFISESTVRFHIQNLKEKLEAQSKTELIAKAIRCGVIQQADEDVASHSGI